MPAEAGNYSISDNSIGSTTLANSIVIGAGSTATTNFTGISSSATGTIAATGNTIQNCTISLGSTYQNAIGIFSSSSSSQTNGALAATATTGTNSNNKFYSNTISNVAYGMYFICEPITTTINESGIDIGGSPVTICSGNR